MRATLLLWLFVGWLLGAGSGLFYVAVSGGWYEWHVLKRGERPQELTNRQGWQPVPGFDDPDYPLTVYRRPRFRLP
jgi:hypothetical protein